MKFQLRRPAGKVKFQPRRPAARVNRAADNARGLPATLLLLGACAFAGAMPSGAQSQQQPPTAAGQAAQHESSVQIDNAQSTSKADTTQVPEANPARPTVTNPAHIPPVGYLQFEQGFNQANGSPAALDRQFSLVQSLRLSLHPRLMVELQSQPLAVTSSPAPGDAQGSAIDPGDLTVGAQGLLIQQQGARPTVALGYLERVRAGSAPDLDIGSFERSAVLLVSGDLGHFHYDSNYLLNEQTATLVRRAQTGETLSITHDLLAGRLDNKLELTGELWHLTQPLVTSRRDGSTASRNHAVGTLWALGYTLRPNIVLDAGFDRGLTRSSTAWQGFLGVTYLMPHRLWPHKGDEERPRLHRHVHRR